MSQISVTRQERVVQVTRSTDRIISAAAVGPQGPQGPPGPAGATTFVALTDTPSGITANFLVAGNGAGDELTFIDPATLGATTFTGLTDTPGTIADGQYLVGSGGSLVFVASIPVADITGLATVATTGSYDDLSDVPATFPPAAHALGTHTDVNITAPGSGQVLRNNGSQWVNAQLDYSDLSGLPTLVTSFTSLTDTPGAIADGQYLVGSGAALAFVASIPATDVSGLATVATTGSYNDLSDLPTLQVPGGSDDQLQFNDGGSFGGIPEMTYDGTNISFNLNDNKINVADDDPFSDPTFFLDGAPTSGLKLGKAGAFEVVGFFLSGAPIFNAIDNGAAVIMQMGGSNLSAVFTGTNQTVISSSTAGIQLVGQNSTVINIGNTNGGVNNILLQPNGAGAVVINPFGNAAAVLQFSAVSLAGSVSLVGPNLATDISFTLPDADGGDNDVMTTDGSGQLAFESVGSIMPVRSINVAFRAPGGGDLAVGTKVYVRVPYAGTIAAVRLIADAVSSVTVGVKSALFSAYTAPGDLTSITGGTDPELNSAIKSTTVISGWTTAVAADTILEFEITAQSSALSTLTIHMEIQPS